MTTPKFTPWIVAQSPTDMEMYCVRGAYLVADCLPIEDARLIAAAPDMYEALRMDWCKSIRPPRKHDCGGYGRTSQGQPR